MALKVGTEDKKKVYMAAGLGAIMLILLLRFLWQNFGPSPAAPPVEFPHAASMLAIRFICHHSGIADPLPLLPGDVPVAVFVRICAMAIALARPVTFVLLVAKLSAGLLEPLPGWLTNVVPKVVPEEN